MAALGASCEQRWLRYELVAAAAALGGLVWAEPAAADDIVYTPVTVSLGIGDSISFELAPFGGGFRLSNLFIATNQPVDEVNIFGNRSAGVLSGGAVLNKGAVIGPGGNFGSFAQLAYAVDISYSLRENSGGPWVDAAGYLGLKFVDAGQNYYGWAQLDVYLGRPYPDIYATLTGYAYNDFADQALTAGEGYFTTPEPGTLGLLALGSLGLGFWRRRKAVGSQQ